MHTEISEDDATLNTNISSIDSSFLVLAGAGLGNAFLSHIAAVDGIYHLVRAFDSDEVIHVDDNVDPIRDLETIQGELCAKVCVVETKYFFKLITLQPSHLLNFIVSSFLFARARRSGQSYFGRGSRTRKRKSS